MPLGYGDIALAAVLIGLNALLFIWLRLKLERQLVIAALRMLVQLSLLALVLKTLFELASPIYTGLAALAMVLFAGYEVLSRQQRRLVHQVRQLRPGEAFGPRRSILQLQRDLVRRACRPRSRNRPFTSGTNFLHLIIVTIRVLLDLYA